jgi:hypothetical protein
MEKGIILLALGNPYYGRCAFNMALSIKMNEPSTHITLLYSPSAVGEITLQMLSFFDNMVLVPEAFYMKNGVARYLDVKTLLYRLSPYDRTIYLDVDALWMPGKKPSAWFDELKDEDFAIGSHKQYNVKGKNEKQNYLYWGDPVKIVAHYAPAIKGDVLPQTQSGFIYFRKCERMREYFLIANSIQNDPHAPTRRWINDGVADEFSFNVSCLITGILPHKIPYYPTHFFEICPIMNDNDLIRNYYAIQMGGAKCEEWIIAAYNRILKEYYLKAGIDPGWYHVDKKKAVPDRAGW